MPDAYAGEARMVSVMAEHETFMRRALVLAARGVGQTAPNPKVGAVVVNGGVVVGEGWHARYGEAHAEVSALASAGSAAFGATVYVTLEPCNHTGQTPPCVDALIGAGVRRVVYAVADPNPRAAGGAARLRALGVDVIGDVLHDEAAELNAPFLFAARRQDRPFVTLKLALSIDGALVDASRGKRWLTNTESRREVHGLRCDADAIAIGINTALTDDPLLTVREVPAPRIAPTRIVFDHHARLPTESALAHSAAEAPVLIVTLPAAASRAARLEQVGVGVLLADSLTSALQQLRDRQVRHVLVEGGAGLASAFMEAGFVDRLVIFQAPVVLGAGALAAFAHLSQGAARNARLSLIARKTLGVDLMSTYAVSAD